MRTTSRSDGGSTSGLPDNPPSEDRRLLLALERQRRLHAIIAAVNDGKEVDAVLLLIRDAVVEAGGFDRAGLFLVEGEGEERRVRGVWGTDPQGERGWVRPPEETSLPLLDGAPYLLIRASDPPDRLPPAWRGQPLVDSARVPMRSGGEIVGILSVDNLVSGRPLLEEDIEALLPFCDAAAATVQWARRDVALSAQQARTAELLETLKEGEARYRRAIAHADAVLYQRDYRTDEFVFVGEGIRRITGYAPDEFNVPVWRGMLQEVVMRGEAAGLTVDDAVRRALSGELAEWRADYRIRTRDGQTRWVADSSIQLPDEAGAPAGSLGVLQDITERKQAEAERENALLTLRESEKTFRLLFANNPHPMWVYDRETLRFLEVNEVATVRYGYSRDEFLLMRITDIRPGEDLPRLQEDLVAPRPDLQFAGQWRHRTRDGRTIDVEIVSHTLEFAGRAAALVVAQDVTERRRAVEERARAFEALQESEARFRAIFDNSLDGIGVSRDARHVYANPAYLALFGFDSSEQIAGVPVLELIAPGEREAIGERIRRRARGEREPSRYETRGRRRDGREFDMELLVSTYQQGGQEYTLVIIRDVTQRKEAEAALRESERRFREILETVQLAAVMLDREGRITYCNDFLLRLTGWQREAVLGRDWFDTFLPEEGRKAARQRFRASVERGAAWPHGEGAVLTRRGERRWVSWNHTLLHGPPGDVIGSTSIGEDITERRLLQARLQTAFERERRIAETLQRSLLLRPPEVSFPGLSLGTVYQPAWSEAQIGGDFFDIFALGEGKAALVVGDASGKGLAAAARTAEVKYALRAFLREYPWPATALARLNDFLCEGQHLDRRDSDAFVVLALAVVDPATGEVTVSAAGAEPPLLVRADGSSEPVNEGGMPVGVEPGEQYMSAALRLAPGDRLVMVTDGITEARRDDRFLGYEGMTRLAAETLSLDSCDAAAAAIMEGARAFADGTLHDDACLLIAQLR